MNIYILITDHGIYEGLNEPIWAFLKKENAEKFQKQMERNISATSTKLIEIECCDSNENFK